ncbi:MAG: cytochrome C oxidase Cbb3 [Planctomycetota bacterium]|nr:MAG: cytochrome C oxidase Cbb3 [Planctomycetota bacterium]
MSESRQDQLTDHSYDGIQEYDNPLPGWWKLLFWGTFGFSVLYWTWFHIWPGQSIIATWEAQVEEARSQGYARFGELKDDAETLVRLMNDPEAVAIGQALFQSKGCVACHGPEGGGVVNLGANFTDDYAINFQTIDQIPNIIRTGVPGTAMVSQTALLAPAEVYFVAAYVASLRGKTVANAKERDPRAKPIEPWPTF